MEPIRKALGAQAREAAELYAGGGPWRDAIREDKRLRREMFELYREAFLEFARRTHDAVLARKDTHEIIEWEKRVADYLRNVGIVKITRMNRSTMDLVEATIQRGVAEGLGISEIGREIRRNIGQGISRTRAERIARTEVIAASNHGAVEGARAAAEAAGLTLEKRWLATSDPRTRATHTMADGQQVPLDSPFTVGGVTLKHPGDYEATAPQETINCRCTVTFIPVD